MTVVAVHAFEDRYHRYALAFEEDDGTLKTGPWGIEYDNLADHVESIRETYPKADVRVEPWSGEEPVDHLPVDEPYPHPAPRRV